MENETTTQLLARYNALAPKPIKAWKGKRTELILRLQTLAAKTLVTTLEATGAATLPIIVTAPVTNGTSAKKETTTKVAVVKKTGKQGIGAACYAMLGEVLYHADDDGTKHDKPFKGSHPVGIAYDKILTRIKHKFPESAVDRHHLRWYANRMRELDQPVPAHREKSHWEVANAKLSVKV